MMGACVDRYGGSGSWYYSTLAGLKRAPGSRSWGDLIIAPPAPGSLSNLTWANASIDTPMGRVGSAWSIATDRGAATAPRRQYSLHATVPPNSRARIVVPVSAAAATVREGGEVVWAGGSFVEAGATAVGGIKGARADLDAATPGVHFEVGGGAYSFVAEFG